MGKEKKAFTISPAKDVKGSSRLADTLAENKKKVSGQLPARFCLDTV